MQLLKKWPLIALSLITVLMFQNCSPSKYSFAQAEMASLETAKTCTISEMENSENVKVLFLIDNSGSNVEHMVNRIPTPGTDPEKKWRMSAMRGLINTYANKENFHYGFISFKGDRSESLIYENDHPSFSNNVDIIESALYDFSRISDEGSTPYRSALLLAKDMILQDMERNDENSRNLYTLVFISDGQPSDYRYVSELSADAKQIMSLAPERISINSVFYYSVNATSTTYLEELARVGQGSMIKANTSDQIIISDRLSMPTEVCK